MASTAKATDKTVTHLANCLTKEVIDVGDDPSQDPSSERSLELFEKLDGMEGITIGQLESTKIGKLVTKARRCIQRYKRKAQTDLDNSRWDKALKIADNVLEKWKKAADEEAKAAARRKKAEVSAVLEDDGTTGRFPSTVAEYRLRLVTHKKDIYKDPPALPPSGIVVESKKFDEPSRDNKTGLLSFSAKDPVVQSLLKDFHPNRTPEEVLRAGSFGGTYFRPIVSAVTNIHYRDPRKVLKDTVPDEWIEGIPMNWLTSSTYKNHVNKYRVSCGGSLGMWESSGWIADVDPYGWFQWYCRFYQGRRCSDDARQISRWLKSAGPKGRFRSQLCNKILMVGTSHDDVSISPVIRQTLLHWGLEITPDILEKHKKRVGK